LKLNHAAQQTKPFSVRLHSTACSGIKRADGLAGTSLFNPETNMDTSAARRAIFKRIRSAHGRPAQTTQAERDAVQDYLRQHAQGPRPAIGNDVVQHFKQQALRMSDTVDEVPSMPDVPAAVAGYLDSIGVARQAVAWKTLQALAWQAGGMQVEFRLPQNEDLVGITGCFCAVAETGTLMLLSGVDTYASAALLPETHIAIVPASRIVAAMEDAFALTRAEHGELPRATNFISGPSRTGDIEQTIVLGAHGPYRVHVVIVGDA
jgi:L-lactate dehydrogenase complex protein LldG